jgi:hypothetical protein
LTNNFILKDQLQVVGEKMRKKILLLLILFLTASNLPTVKPAPPQTPVIEWQKTYGPIQGESIAQANDGGYVIAAQAANSATENGEGNVGEHVEAIKTDLNGNIVWNLTIGDSNYTAKWIAATSGGGYVVAGRASNPSAVAWLVKIDSEGTMLWNKIYPQTGNDMFLDSATQTSDGGFALIGVTAAGETFVIKTNSKGDVQWSKTYSAFVGSLITETAEGDYIIAGDSGEAEIWLIKTHLAKINQTGGIQWDKVYENKVGYRPRCLITTSDDGFMLAGAYYLNESSAVAFAMKTDSNGNLEWNQTYGENPGFKISGFRIAVQNTNESYLFAGGVIDSEQHYGARLVQTDSVGNMEWETAYVGQGNGYVNALVQTDENSYTFTGATGGANSGATEIWLVHAGPAQTMPIITSWIIIAVTVATITMVVLLLAVYLRMRKISEPTRDKNVRS